MFGCRIKVMPSYPFEVPNSERCPYGGLFLPSLLSYAGGSHTQDYFAPKHSVTLHYFPGDKEYAPSQWETKVRGLCVKAQYWH